MWKGNFYKFLIEAEKIAFTPENIRSGFWWTGLVPLDFDVVQRRLDIPNLTFNSTVPVAPLSPSSPIQPLSSLTPTEVYAISTPYNHRTFHQLRGSLALDLQGNSLRSSRLKYAFDKISNAHISKLHHCGDLEERLETETKRKAASRQQKPLKRRRIPDEGRAFTSVADIDDYEASLRRKSQDTQLARLARLKEKADKLDPRVQELTAKRERYLAMEKNGKRLPATWKSVARLQEEEEKVRDCLQKMQEDICFLEQTLKGLSGSESENDLVLGEDTREVMVLDF